jgi:DNA-directed RNA polymerase specialized sigma24 family protein
MSYRDEARRALESSAAQRAHDEYLKQIKEQHPALRRLAGVDELLALLRNPEADADTKDAVLIALLEEHQRGRGGGAFALLAVAMFPVLDRIYRARVLRTQEHDDLWGRVVEAFAEALERYPIARRRARVAANIEGETMAMMRRAALRDVRSSVAKERFTAATQPFVDDLQAEGEQPVSLGEFVEPGRESPLPPEEAELKAAERAVAPIFAAGDIDDEDRFLILGVHLYGRTLGELAAGLGISREAAKKRHLRAIARLRALRGDDDERE